MTDLLLEQVECADIVIINKCDLLESPGDLELVKKVTYGECLSDCKVFIVIRGFTTLGVHLNLSDVIFIFLPLCFFR